MQFSLPDVLLWLAVVPCCHAAETVLGLYIYSRHGDRSAKATPPTYLTDLGYREVFDSATWFRNQYISSEATRRVQGLNADVVRLSQIAASAPLDTVLMPSAQGFLQGLYPPVGSQLGSQILRNGTRVETPLDGYQLVPIQTISTGAGSEDSAWLQGSSNCANALVSSNSYYISSDYMTMSNSTKDFYARLQPVVNVTFNSTQNTFRNAYSGMQLILHFSVTRIR